MFKPLVYIASPYTKGDAAINVRFQCEVFNRMLGDRVVTPIAPLWSHFQHVLFPRPYKDWIAYDLNILDHCDACLRLTSRYAPMNYQIHESSGADGEVEFCKEKGINVFHSIESLYEWAKTAATNVAVADGWRHGDDIPSEAWK